MVYHYSTSTNTWDYWSTQTGGALQSMTDGGGYWIHTKSADVLTVYGLEATTIGYNLQASWNILGFTSIEEQDYDSYLGSIGDSCSLMYGWDAAAGSWFSVDTNQGGGNLEPGHGYWVYMNAPGTVLI